MTEPPHQNLTERRKDQTRADIARAAVRLFDAKGVAATSGEEIARAAGVSVRTLWRYFPTKESCVMPLLAAGIRATAEQLRSWPAGIALSDHLAQTAGAPTGIDAATLATLVPLVAREPALRGVWLEANHAAEPVFAQALAARAGRPGDADALDIRVRAAALNAALRVAAEQHAWRVRDESRGGEALGAIAETTREALRALETPMP